MRSFLLGCFLLVPSIVMAVDLPKVYADFNQALNSGRIKHPGFDQAFQVLVPLAEQGNVEAMYYVSQLYYLGVGGAKRDADKARQLIVDSASKGYAVAQRQLAYNYERGIYGRIDNAEAESGSCLAIRRLIKAYSNGELGLKSDAEKTGSLEKKLGACQ